MSDEILNENSELDESGNKKSFLAEDMKSGELMTIVNNFKQEFNCASEELLKTDRGESYSESKVALQNLITVCSGGPHIEFAKKNNRLRNKSDQDKFLTSGGSLGIEEKQDMLYFVDMVQESTAFRLEFIRFMTECIGGVLESAFRAIRFEQKMVNIYTGEDRQSIVEAFAGFGNLYEKYNQASIFDIIPIRKSTGTIEENAKTILTYLDKDIKGRPQLNRLLLSSERNNAEGMNALRIIDRETSAFATIAQEKSAFKNAVDICNGLDEKLLQCYVFGKEKLFPYFSGYEQVLNILVNIFGRAFNIVDNFESKKSEVPYAVMHYEPLVRDCVSKYILNDLSDPFTSGTNYCEVAGDMATRYNALARNIAKCAPD